MDASPLNVCLGIWVPCERPRKTGPGVLSPPTPYFFLLPDLLDFKDLVPKGDSPFVALTMQTRGGTPRGVGTVLTNGLK